MALWCSSRQAVGTTPSKSTSCSRVSGGKTYFLYLWLERLSPQLLLQPYRAHTTSLPKIHSFIVVALPRLLPLPLFLHYNCRAPACSLNKTISQTGSFYDLLLDIKYCLAATSSVCFMLFFISAGYIIVSFLWSATYC